jgi:hypothetical protein
MKITGIETHGHPSRTAAFRAYFEANPTATAEDAAAHFDCTLHQVWSYQANERRRKEIAARRDDRRPWLCGFAAALAEVCRVGHGMTAPEVLAEHELTVDALAEAGAAERDIEAIRESVAFFVDRVAP